MEYLQYVASTIKKSSTFDSFKPYYKWNTFNTILEEGLTYIGLCFKPYYKWNTFNTKDD